MQVPGVIRPRTGTQREIISTLPERPHATAGDLQRTEGGPGVAHEYNQVSDPGAGEVSIPDRDDAIAEADPPGHSSSNTYYTRNVRVFAGDRGREDDSPAVPAPTARAPPAPGTIEVSGPPD
jgi:hypothetical protein